MEVTERNRENRSKHAIHTAGCLWTGHCRLEPLGIESRRILKSLQNLSLDRSFPSRTYSWESLTFRESSLAPFVSPKGMVWLTSYHMLSETEWNGVNWNEEYYIGIYLSVDILVHFTHPFLYMSFTTKKIIILYIIIIFIIEDFTVLISYFSILKGISSFLLIFNHKKRMKNKIIICFYFLPIIINIFIWWSWKEIASFIHSIRSYVNPWECSEG